MLNHPPDEVFARQRFGAKRVGLAVGVAKGHASLLIAKDIGCTDHAPVEIARQVFQGRFTPARLAAIDHPFTR